MGHFVQLVGGGFLGAEDVQGVVDGPVLQTETRHALEN